MILSCAGPSQRQRPAAGVSAAASVTTIVLLMSPLPLGHFVKQYHLDDPNSTHRLSIATVPHQLQGDDKGEGPLRDPSDCSICPGAVLPDMILFRQHFKSDWHIYNLGQQTRGRPVLSRDSFERSGEASDSDSPNEETDDTDAVELPGSPLLRFTLLEDGSLSTESPTVVFSIHKVALLTADECSRRAEVSREAIDLQQRLLEASRSWWALFLIRSGRVAAGIFDNASGRLTLSKTFKRYTTRRGQGGAQAAKDASHHGIRSAGATIRRRNELHLIQDMTTLLVDWAPSLAQCTRWFWNGTETARHCLFPTAADARDPRWRRIPLSTGQPSLEELLRCYSVLSAVSLESR